MRAAIATHRGSTKILATGFALFAMFFGAGNMVFPLYLGANAGNHLSIIAVLFIFVGVGTPLLGLISMGLFQGDYWTFFRRLGPVTAFSIITFLILIIGPLSAAPRTETITYQSMLPFLPSFLNNSIIFSIFYCTLVYFLTFRELKVVDIIGKRITPVKLACFILLIVLSMSHADYVSTSSQTLVHQSVNAISMGYGTMDMLGAFFFCAIAMRNIRRAAVEQGCNDENEMTQLLLKACLVGSGLIALIYSGFMFAAAAHARTLAGLAPDKLIATISYIVLGRFGAFFVAMAVTFACLATAVALADVCSSFFHNIIFRNKISKNICLLGVIFVMFVMTQLGFSGIMRLATPVLEVVYPSLITLCVMNILYKKYGIKYVKVPVALTAVVSLVLTIIN